MIAYLRSGLRRTLCLSLLMLGSARSIAQETIDFSPDAPGATTGVNIMKQGKIDWETGIVLEWDRRNGEHARTFTIIVFFLVDNVLVCFDKEYIPVL